MIKDYWLKVLKEIKQSFLKKSAEKGSALVLIDWENIVQNWPSKGINLTYDSVYQRFTNLLKRVTKEAGAVFAVYVFSPDYLTSTWAETFWELGFPVINCPKIKKESEKDTVDETLIREGKKLINLPISHLCVVSGDSDFIPLYDEASRKNIKIIIVAASLDSLSRDLFAENKTKRKVLLFDF